MLDRREYEEYYGEHIGYCRIHHIQVLSSCLACEEDEQGEKEMINCIACTYKSEEPEDFVKIPIKVEVPVEDFGDVFFLCQGCYDDYIIEVEEAKRTLQSTQVDRLSNAINTDYLH